MNCSEIIHDKKTSRLSLGMGDSTIGAYRGNNLCFILRPSNQLDTFQIDDLTNSFQELVGSAKKRKQFFILGGLCVLAVLVILAIVLSVIFIKKDDKVNVEALHLTDILRGAFQPKRFNGTWIDDNSFYFFDTRVSWVLNLLIRCQ